MYTVSKKCCTPILIDNFVNSWWIIKIFFHWQNLWKIWDKTVITIQPHQKSVATVPCENYMFENWSNPTSSKHSNDKLSVHELKKMLSR